MKDLKIPVFGMGQSARRGQNHQGRERKNDGPRRDGGAKLPEEAHTLLFIHRNGAGKILPFFASSIINHDPGHRYDEHERKQQDIGVFHGAFLLFDISLAGIFGGR